MKMSIIAYISFIILINIIKSHVYIASPKELQELFKLRTGRDEIYSNFANYGKIPYGYNTVILFI